MLLVAVHASVRQQAHEVDGPPVGHRRTDRLAEHTVLQERAILDGRVDARQLLVHDPPGAHVEMPYL